MRIALIQQYASNDPEANRQKGLKALEHAVGREGSLEIAGPSFV